MPWIWSKLTGVAAAHFFTSLYIAPARLAKAAIWSPCSQAIR